MIIRRPELALATCALVNLAGCPETPHESNSTLASGTGFGETTDDGANAEFFLEHRSYFIGETKKFDEPGECQTKNLIAVTATLRDRLDGANWSGRRFVDDNSWPEDFWEATLDTPEFDPGDGLDDLHGDAARLSVYAGHGDNGVLVWGRPGPSGECLSSVDEHSRFGRLGGNRAAAVMFVTSCTLHEPALRSNLELQASRQFLGFHDSPYVGFDELRQVFKRTQDGQSTGNAWLDELEDNGKVGRNSPVVATCAATFEEAQTWFDTANLASGSGYVQNVAQPPGHLYYEWLDNNCECDGCEESSVALPEITVGDAALALGARRPVRSAEQLEERTRTLVGLLRPEPGAFDDPPPSPWTSPLLTLKDVSFTRWPGKLEVSYDPATDRLTVVDRAALLRARPAGPDEVGPGFEIVDEQAARIEAETILARLEASDLGEGAVVGLPDALPEALPLELETVRKAGFVVVSDDDEPEPAIAFEYLFGASRRIAGLRVAGARVRVGVTRLGEASRVEISALDVEVVATPPILRSPSETLASVLAELEAEHPGATAVALFADVGWALAEDRSEAVCSPSLLLEYSLRFTSSVSRRVPVAISLTDADASVVELAAIGPDDGGDPRPAP